MSFISLGLTCSSNLHSTDKAGEEFTSNSHGLLAESSSMSNPNSSKQVFILGTTEQKFTKVKTIIYSI